MMTKTQRDEFASRAERAYAERWSAVLEPDHFGELIAVVVFEAEGAVIIPAPSWSAPPSATRLPRR